MEVLVQYKDTEVSVLISPEDFSLVQDKALRLHSQGYVTVYEGMYTDALLHRLVASAMGLDPKLYVDHINGNKLDNRRCNLRSATVAQNGANSQVRSHSKSGLKGVQLRHYKSGTRYQARISVNKKTIHLGNYETPQDAARAYNKAAIEHYGEFARLNQV